MPCARSSSPRGSGPPPEGTLPRQPRSQRRHQASHAAALSAAAAPTRPLAAPAVMPPACEMCAHLHLQTPCSAARSCCHRNCTRPHVNRHQRWEGQSCFRHHGISCWQHADTPSSSCAPHPEGRQPAGRWTAATPRAIRPVPAHCVANDDPEGGQSFLSFMEHAHEDGTSALGDSLWAACAVGRQT